MVDRCRGGTGAAKYRGLANSNLLKLETEQFGQTTKRAIALPLLGEAAEPRPPSQRSTHAYVGRPPRPRAAGGGRGSRGNVGG